MPWRWCQFFRRRRSIDQSMIRQALICDAALKGDARLNMMALRQAASTTPGNMAVLALRDGPRFVTCMKQCCCKLFKGRRVVIEGLFRPAKSPGCGCIQERQDGPAPGATIRGYWKNNKLTGWIEPRFPCCGNCPRSSILLVRVSVLLIRATWRLPRRPSNPKITARSAPSWKDRDGLLQS